MEALLGITEEPLRISAKAGIGIKDVLQKIIDAGEPPHVPSLDAIQDKNILPEKIPYEENL